MNEEENVKEEPMKEENLEVSENNDVDCQEEVINKISFLNSLEAIFLDQIVIFILSAVGILLLSLILNVIGYFILSSYYVAFLLIAYVTISILYPAIMEAYTGNTLGRKICNQKIVKIK